MVVEDVRVEVTGLKGRCLRARVTSRASISGRRCAGKGRVRRVDVEFVVIREWRRSRRAALRLLRGAR